MVSFGKNWRLLVIIASMPHLASASFFMRQLDRASDRHKRRQALIHDKEQDLAKLQEQREKLWKQHDDLELQEDRPKFQKKYFAEYVARLRAREIDFNKKIEKELDHTVLKYYREQQAELLSYIQEGEKRIQAAEKQFASLKSRKDALRKEIDSITQILCQFSIFQEGYWI